MASSAVFPRCLFAGGATAFTLQYLLRPGWSIQKKMLVCLFFGYLPSYFDGSEYRAAPRRSLHFQRFAQRAFRRLVRSIFNVRVGIEDKDALVACNQCIIAVHPHGMLSLDHGLTFCGYSEELDALHRRAAIYAKQDVNGTSCLRSNARTKQSSITNGPKPDYLKMRFMS